MKHGKRKPDRSSVKDQSPALSLLGFLMIIAGIGAVVGPFFMAARVEAFIATILIAFAVLDLGHTVFIRPTKTYAPREIPNLLSIALALVAAGILLFHPLDSYLTFTTLVAAYIGVDAVITMMIAMRVRKSRMFPIVLANGVAGVVLALIMWWVLPGAPLATIATLLGVYLVFDGVVALGIGRSERNERLRRRASDQERARRQQHQAKKEERQVRKEAEA